MSEEWKVGDLAMCVAWMAVAPLGIISQLRPGFVGRVAYVGHCPADPATLLLGFAEFGSRQGFEAIAFRKIAPHEPDCEDAITVRQLNGISKLGDEDLHLAPRKPQEAQR